MMCIQTLPSIPAMRDLRAPCAARLVIAILLAMILALPQGAFAQAPQTQPVLSRYLAEVPAATLVPGAESYGPMHGDLPVAPVLQGGQTVGWAFITSDFVGTTGYSGKPIHVMVAVDGDARVTGVRLVKHSEPIVLIGIPESRIVDLIDGYVGLDLVAAAEERTHDLDIISGATVTIMVIDDSVLRSGLRVARALGLGGLEPQAATSGPRFTLDPAVSATPDWMVLTGDGTIRRMSLDIAQINAAFAALPDPRAGARPVVGAPTDTFIDMYASLVSIPAIGEAVLGERANSNLQGWLKDGDHAILVAGRGLYSFKGSGYVRGGIFDRIQLIQGDISVRFRDRNHRRVNGIAATNAPALTEMDLFRIPADTGFDPTQPWQLQLLVQRDIAATERAYTTFEMGWRPPQAFLKPVAAAASAQSSLGEDEQAAKTALWQRIWRDKTPEIAGLVAMLTVLTGVFFFQDFFTRSERLVYWFRIGFLSVTLVFLGWYANAQLSVVNLMALANSLMTGFSWDAFLMEPLTFILWFSVAAALLFWGRGAYCGWLCPFGALQELTNKIGKLFHIPQWTLPWGLHERLWPVKYLIFLALFGVSLASLEQAEHLAEVEPFKTAIILKFARAWPFVLFAVSLLVVGLFIERFYCRYLCPLGAALAIPARLRMFDWLKRYHDCGNPCQTCANECFVQAIHPTGEINPNECLNCLNCQVLYRSETKCPVVIRKLKRRATASQGAAGLDRAIGNHPNLKEKTNG